MKSVEIIMMPVSDRQKAKEFYLKLGFEVRIDATDPHGEPWIQLALPGDETSISLSSFQGFIFETENIIKEAEILKEKGIEIGKIDETPWGRFAWFQDLDGNGLCLHER